MKKILAFLLAAFMLFSMAACNETEAPETTTEEPEVFVSSTLIQGGKSDYVIVHDGTSPAKELANAVKKAVLGQFGVQLEIVAGKSTTEASHEIVIGNSRPIAEKTIKKLTGMFDFALKVEENKLVLCAKDELSYQYLGEYLAREVFVKTEGEDLVLDSDDNVVYSNSALNEVNYVDYLRSAEKKINVDELFTWGNYEGSDIKLPYRLYVPFNYNPEKSYPLVVHLHGAGYRGDDNARPLTQMKLLFDLKDAPVDEAIILVPQCPEDSKWVNADWSQGSYTLSETSESKELKAVVNLIGEVQKTYSVDESRVYATGFSMGGYGTWNLLMNHPDMFAAAIAMCGAADPSKAGILKDIPIWAVHGAQDPTVPVAGTQEIVNAIKNAGGTKINYTELPENQHDVWTYTYTNPEIINWLFQQTKA